ncbi:hypothetical protein F53441_11370 [Fusarium austroafricanum]|uniref:F-box domain-containing protein n=1 Tax=Fusarium austroafricanum TaxID=2364996 RepID=A0A8H4K6K9_9HYPO|nr:hypothetical protein F53441_11370 [Fusarium austroafricanum]
MSQNGKSAIAMVQLKRLPCSATSLALKVAIIWFGILLCCQAFSFYGDEGWHKSFTYGTRYDGIPSVRAHGGSHCLPSLNTSLLSEAKSLRQTCQQNAPYPYSDVRIGRVAAHFGSAQEHYRKALRTHVVHSLIHDNTLDVMCTSVVDALWNKPAFIMSILLREMMKPVEERLEWLFWVDRDTVILDQCRPLSSFLSPVDTRRFDSQGIPGNTANLKNTSIPKNATKPVAQRPGKKPDKPVHLLVTKDWNGLNNGVFFLRVNQWAIDLFSDIAAFRYYRPNVTLQFTEQSAMDIVMNEPKFKPSVRYIPQEWFNTYPKGSAVAFEGMMGEAGLKEYHARRGDFLLHFAGRGGRDKSLNEWTSMLERTKGIWPKERVQRNTTTSIHDFWNGIHPDALKWRRALVQLKREGRDPDEESEEEDQEYVEWHPDDERHMYDPELVDNIALVWLGELVILGFNPCAEGAQKTYMAEAEPYNDFGVIDFRPGDDPNEPEVTEVGCYNPSDIGQDAVFPFHKVCYIIFSEVITSKGKLKCVDKDLLYDVMCRLAGSYATSLDINYGPISGQDQKWEAIPGEEFSVINPMETDDFYRHTQQKIASGAFEKFSNVPMASPKCQGNDPFSGLSNELLWLILDHLSADELLAFSSSSRPVYLVTEDISFWKARIAIDMPYLTHLDTHIEDSGLEEDIDFKKLYAWLNTVTKPMYGIGKPFMGIMNRRRIWQSCMDLKSWYDKAAAEPTRQIDPKIPKRAYCPLMVKTGPTERPRDQHIIKTMWFHSFEEACDLPYVLEAYWNEDELLTGIGTAFGDNLRIFGIKAETKTAWRIEAGSQINSLILYLGAGSGLAENVVGIQGIAVRINGRRSKLLLGNDRGQGCRPLTVSPSAFLVGIQGQTSENGIISRLGILESTKSEEESLSIEPRPLREKLLWACSWSATWEHQSTTIVTLFPTECHTTPLEDDLRLYESLRWAASKKVMEKLYQISAHISPDGLILGFRIEYVRNYWEPKRYVGDAGDWPENEMKHLTLDGAAGEIITEIGVNASETLDGIMLRTNKGNFVIFGQGELGTENWRMARPPEGEFVVGIVASFGMGKESQAKKSMVTLAMLHERLE